MNLIKYFFKQNHSAPKKELGQNFLENNFYLNVIASEVTKLSVQQNSSIYELGAGFGSLTKTLLEKKLRVVAIEKDISLYNFLEKRFSRQIASGTLKLEKTDILNFLNGLGNNSVVCGNIPYNLTAPIILGLLKEKAKLTAAIITIQEEVANKILSSPHEPKYGSFSVLIQTFFNCAKICKIPSNAFYPVPKVNSTVICLTPKKRNTAIDEIAYTKFLLEVFSKKRKNISHFFKKKEHKNFCFEDFKINSSKRPQDLSAELLLRIFLN